MDNDLYDLRVTFRVKIKKWRIDDQASTENREWSLNVHDRNLNQWVNVNELTRPGESAGIESIEEVNPRGASRGLEGVNSVL
jgi:hypothetical protein